jgi:hypothetical protein
VPLLVLLFVIPQQSEGICGCTLLLPVFAVAVVAAVVCSCRHPERSEGPRSSSLIDTARTFQPTNSSRCLSFCLSIRNEAKESAVASVVSSLATTTCHPERSCSRICEQRSRRTCGCPCCCLFLRLQLDLLLPVLAVILSETKDPEALHSSIPLEPFSQQTPAVACPFVCHSAAKRRNLLSLLSFHHSSLATTTCHPERSCSRICEQRSRRTCGCPCCCQSLCTS